MADQVGPIVFSVPRARRQLEDHGEVYTFRPDERTTGETWWRASRTGSKEGDVRVELIEEVNPRQQDNLAPYAHKSGFNVAVDWMRAILRLHDEMPVKGYIYRVTLLEDADA